MDKAEVQSFEDLLKGMVKGCETIDGKFNCLIDIIANQTKLLDIALNSLPARIQRTILKKAGFKEQNITQGEPNETV